MGRYTNFSTLYLYTFTAIAKSVQIPEKNVQRAELYPHRKCETVTSCHVNYLLRRTLTCAKCNGLTDTNSISKFTHTFLLHLAILSCCH